MNSRSTAFRIAWTIARETKCSFSQALKNAWQVYRLKKAMRSDYVTFKYVKTDGTMRTATGTLKDVHSLVKGTGKSTFKSVAYFDKEKESFRSFKPQNLIDV